MRLIVIGHALASCLMVFIIIFLFLSFSIRSQGYQSIEGIPRTGIVFTGQFDRVQLGLRLMDDGQFDRLIISGVNSGAGIEQERFAVQFELSANLRKALESGAIVLASGARTTIENGYETACWLQENDDIQAVTLITSKRHMARAFLALHSLRPHNVEIVRLSTPKTLTDEDYNVQISEFLAYSATWLFLLIPNWALPGEGNLFCNLH